MIIDGPRDPQLNMAIDEAIARLRAEVGVDTLRIYMWLPTGVSLGRGQDPRLAVNLAEIGRRGYRLVRRPTGGAALLHREGGEITYSVVLSSSHPLYALDVASSAARIAEGLAEALRRLGLDARVGGFRGPGGPGHLCYLREGSSDVVVSGRKVSGSAQRRAWGSLLQHGTLLLEFDPEEWLSVINAGRSGMEELRGYVAGLAEIMGEKPPIGRLVELIVEGMASALGYREWYRGSLTPGEVELSWRLYRVKYSRAEWNLMGRE